MDSRFGTLDREVVKMIIKGVKLVEVTEPQIFEQAQKMFVWDFESCDESSVSIKEVLVILPNKEEYRRKEIKPVLATDGTKWNFCAKIPSPRIATNRELSRWLSQGNGELSIHNTEIHTYFNYTPENADSECKDEILKVRKWSDTEWHTPDVEYLDIEE